MPGQPIQFTDLSSGSITNYFWNFDDGAISTTQNPTHIYLAPGTYQVFLIVTDSGSGQSDTTSQTITINLPATVDAGQHVNFCSGGSVQLNATASGPGTFLWLPSTGLSCSTCPNPVASPSAPTTYFVTFTDNFGCQAEDSVTVTPGHCPSVGLDQSRGWLRTFCIGSQCHVTTNDNGFGNFVNISGKIGRGTVSPFKVVPGGGGSNRDQFYVKIFLDLNRDCHFDPVTELLFSSNTPSSDTISGNFLIPNSATPGTARLRVILTNENTTGPCGPYTRGETHDYSIIISQPYCNTGAQATTQAFVQSFCVNTTCLNTGNNNGLRVHNTTTSLVAGATFNLTLTPGFVGAPVPVFWKVYNDNNRNGNYTDPGEELFASAGASSSVVNGTFTIPANAVNGPTRLRIVMSTTPITSACSVPDGEIEEVRFKITGGLPARTFEEGSILDQDEMAFQFNFSLFPNPGSNFVTLSTGSQSPDDRLQVEIFDLSGKLHKSLNINIIEGQARLSVSDLASGLYMIKVSHNGISGIQKLMIAR